MQPVRLSSTFIANLPERLLERAPLPRWLPELTPPTRATQIAELEDVRALVNTRTPEKTARVAALNDPERIAVQLLREYAQEVGPLQAARGAALVSRSMAESALYAHMLKARSDVIRPHRLDQTIQHPPGTTPITTLDGDPLGSSFPSAHAAMAWGMATTMSRLWLERGATTRAAQMLDLAAEMSTARVYSGVHSPSDIAAGKLIGTGVADRVLSAATVARTQPEAAAAR